MHTRDYSDDTARVIDEEVERILREQEERGRKTLREHRRGLDAVAASLLEHETLDGHEVTRLVDEAAGRHAGGPRKMPRADAPATDVGNTDGDSADAGLTDGAQAPGPATSEPRA
jgi:cell division protease FtsH